MKVHFLLFSLLFTVITFSQNKAIKITSSSSSKEILIKENKRIRVKTSKGQTISGKFTILDQQNILVKNNKIALSEIIKLKRNPVLVSIIINGFLFYNAAAFIAAGLIIYSLSSHLSAFLLTIPATALVYAGIKSPNLLKGYKTGEDWKYEVITIPDF